MARDRGFRLGSKSQVGPAAPSNVSSLLSLSPGFSPSAAFKSIVTASSVNTMLIHVGCANVGRCRRKPRPRISIFIPSFGVYASLLNEKYPMRWIDMPVRIRRTANKIKDNKYRSTITPKMKVGFKSAIKIVQSRNAIRMVFALRWPFWKLPSDSAPSICDCNPQRCCHSQTLLLPTEGINN